MEAYKRGSHTVWDCKYHLVWGDEISLSDEIWAEYIKNQTPPEPDDDFKVT
jgi:hypothetical protein